MFLTKVVLLQLLWLFLASATHHYGGLVTYTAKKTSHGKIEVEVRNRATFRECYYQYGTCRIPGTCGHNRLLRRGVIDSSPNSATYGNWCQTESVVTKVLTTEKSFTTREYSCCWILLDTANRYPYWSVLTKVDLGIRSDTNAPNNSPATAIVPFLRVPRNCPRIYRPIFVDPEGDVVRCRYGNRAAEECYDCRRQYQFQVNEASCTLQYRGYGNYGVHGLELVVEDFPRRNMKVTYADGSISYRSGVAAGRRKRAAGTTTAFPTTTTPYPTTTTPYPTTTTTTTAAPTTTTYPPTTITYPPTTTTAAPTTTTAAPTTTTYPPTTTTYPPTTTTAAPTTTTAAPTTTTAAPTTTTAAPTTTTAAPTTTSHPWWWAHTTTTAAPTTTTSAPTTTTAAPTTTTAAPTTTTAAPTTTTAAPTTTTAAFTTTTAAPTTTTAAPTTTSYPTTTTTRTPTTHTTRTTTSPWSPIPLGIRQPFSVLPFQFVFKVDPHVTSCTEGLYLPQFVSPTPRHGDMILAQVGKEVEIRVKAQARYSTVDHIIMSGPLNITKHRTTGDVFTIKWTPIQEDTGHYFPICFVVEFKSGSYIYQTEMRCVVVNVTDDLINTVVTCKESSMTVEVEKATLPRIHYDQLYLSDPSNKVCSLQTHSNSTHVVAIVPLNRCGTQIDEDDDYLLFKNEITTVDSPSSLITRRHQVEIKFECQYKKHGNVTTSFSAHRDKVTVWDKGLGQFTYGFEFFPDKGYGKMIDPRLYPLDYDVGDRIFMEIEATTTVDNTVLFVESCEASPYDNPSYKKTYSIIADGCDKDSTLIRHPVSHKRQFRFSLEAFKFIGLHEQVYISCSVMMCEAGKVTRCSKGCQPKSRSKREAAIESASHYVSQGPLRLRRSVEAAGNTGLNLNIVFIAGCVLAALGMICGVIFFKVKKTTIKYQPLSSEEN